LSEALLFAENGENMLCIKLFRMSETISVHNMFSPGLRCLNFTKVCKPKACIPKEFLPHNKKKMLPQITPNSNGIVSFKKVVEVIVKNFCKFEA
jgi:phage terminase large subunit